MIAQIEPREAARRLADPSPPHLLDVREEEEHRIARVPGATLIPLGELAARLNEIAAWKNDEVLVLCHHGLRSAHAVAHLRASGFSKLYNVRGGIDLWSRTVDPSIPKY